MKNLSIILVALALLTLGCSTTKTTVLNIAGPPGTSFSVKYKAGPLAGTISTVTSAQGPSEVLQLSRRGDQLDCDISKRDPAVDLSAEIVQGGKTVFRAHAPAGTQGVRISRTDTGWTQQTY